MGKNNEVDIILHGCNCFNTMGAGIAAQIASNFPDAKLADDETLRGDAGKLGTYTIGVDALGSLTCTIQDVTRRDNVISVRTAASHGHAFVTLTTVIQGSTSTVAIVAETPLQ